MSIEIKVLIAMYPVLSAATAIFMRSLFLDAARGDPRLYWGWKPRLIYLACGLLWPLVLVVAVTFGAYLKLLQFASRRGKDGDGHA